MTDNLPELPEPKRVYTFAGFNEWFTLDQIHSYALTAIASERARADALDLENALMREAVEACYDTVQSMDWVDSDSDQACRRVALRRLNEAVGKSMPRLLMERPEGQKLYGLNYRELKERADALEAALSEVIEMAQEHADQFSAAFAGYKPERHAYYAKTLVAARSLLEKTPLTSKE